MRTLVVEDDFTSRKMLQQFLLRYGSVDLATDGEEAMKAFRAAADAGQTYDLICLDIMMPKMNGQQVLEEIRKREAESGIHFPHGSKIIMTTALDDRENVIGAFRSQCEAYLVKPLDTGKLLKHMVKLGLIAAPSA
mgnify:CR=1 FL=1